jgi:hydrogenase maturation protease
VSDLLILGLGNLLCGDDGAGAAVAGRIARDFELPPNVAALDGGTLGLSLLPYLEDARDAILVDAVRLDAPPGSLVRLEGDAVGPAVAARLSPHQIGVADLLDGVRLLDRLPRRLILWGVVPATIELGFGPSPPVARALSTLLHHVVSEARELGYELHPRRDARDPDGLLGLDVARLYGQGAF